jgi:hypothetical protein
VSLDTEKLHRLKGKKFDQLYAKNSPKWNEMVANATEYTKTIMDKSGDKLRGADISEILQNAIKIDPQFESYLESKKLTQKFWAAWFADYVVEQVYPLPDIQ